MIKRQPQPGDFAEDQAEKLVSMAEVIGITGIAFTNHTIEHVLELSEPQTYAVILVGTTPLSPVLFDYDVDAISGAHAIAPKIVLHSVSQGGGYLSTD